MLGLMLSATAYAGTSDVDRELRALADRAARYASPAGLAPLFEERIAASDVAGLADVIRSRTGGASIGGAADHGWLAAAYGAAGERAEVEKLAAEVEAELAKAPKDRLGNAARCGVAVGFEYLRDHAASDRWRQQATGAMAWCRERLPVVAARLGEHERATALLAEQKQHIKRLEILLALADVYAGTAQNARVAPLLEEAEKLVAAGEFMMPSPARSWPLVAARWAAAGNKKRAKAAAQKGLAALDEEARDTPEMLLVLGDDVAEGLAAAGDRSTLARLVARLEKGRAKDDRFVARVQNARIVAKYGAKARGRRLVAAVADELDGRTMDALGAGARFALIDSYLALGDLPAAIDQARSTSVTQPIEVEGLIKIARYCRQHRCVRTKAVTAALAAVAAQLDRIDAARK